MINFIYHKQIVTLIMFVVFQNSIGEVSEMGACKGDILTKTLIYPPIQLSEIFCSPKHTVRRRISDSRRFFYFNDTPALLHNTRIK